MSTVLAVKPSNLALSILEKLHVPDGWCSSGFKANEYTAIPSKCPPEADPASFLSVSNAPEPLW